MNCLSYFRVGILTLLLNLGESTANEGQPHVIGPLKQIEAAPGDDVILPCHLEPRLNVEKYTVEWSKPDIKPDPSDPLGRVDYVHLYRDQRNEEKMQLSAYVGRTELPADGLRQGNMSLMIRNVTTEDTGRYRCFIPKLNGKVKESILYLSVDPNFAKTSTTEMPLPDHNTFQRPGPKDETEAGGRSHPGTLISLGFAFLLILIMGVKLCSTTAGQNNLLESGVPSSSSSLEEVSSSSEEKLDCVTAPIRSLY